MSKHQPKAKSEAGDQAAQIPQAADVAGEIEAMLDREAAQAAAPDSDGPKGGGETPDPEDFLDLDLGEGVKQKIARGDLAKLWLRQQELDQREKLAEAAMARSIGAKRLAEQIESYDEQTQQVLLQIIQNPQLLTQGAPKPEGKAQPQGEDDFDFDRFMGTQNPNGKAPAESGTNREIAALKQQLAQTMGFVQAMANEKAQTNLRERIGAVVDSFDVLKNDASARAWAERTLQLEFQANPNADLNALAAQYAAAAHKVAMRHHKPLARSVDVRGRGDEFPDPKDPFSGDDLMKGRVSDELIQQLFGSDR